MPRSKPEWKVLSVTFEITAQNTGHFSVPEAIAKLLQASPKDSLNFLIARVSGERIFEGPKVLVSGNEIMGSEIKEGVKPGERIRVQASRLASK